MVSLNKIFVGMEVGPEALQQNFDSIVPRLSEYAVYSLSSKDFLASSDTANKVNTITGKILRYGKMVQVAMHITASFGSAQDSFTNIIAIPAGYKPNNYADQLALDIEQSGMSNNTRALTQGTLIAAHGITGNCYIAGVWMTDDDMPV